MLMHGWGGANAEDLTSLAPMLRLTDYQFIFPQAPLSPSSSPDGTGLVRLETPEYEGLAETQQQVKDSRILRSEYQVPCPELF